MSIEIEELKSEIKQLKEKIKELHQDAETSYRESMIDEHDLNEQTNIINGLMRDKERLREEIERLIEAGNLLAFHYIEFGRKFFPDDPLPKSINDWNLVKDKSTFKGFKPRDLSK
jgi:predicted nuclease with TOPRIM domain